MIKGLTTKLKALCHDRKGVGAIEFAFIFPILLILYIGAFELTVAFNIYKRTASAAGSIGDLVSQQTTVDPAFLSTTPHLAAAIFTPYSTTGIEIKITGILVDGNRVPRVHWSWSNKTSAPYAVGSVVALRQNMRDPQRFFVRTELSIPHAILRFMTTEETAIRRITISNDDLYEKRVSDPIICNGCK